jgi:hypothetical protein
METTQMKARTWTDPAGFRRQTFRNIAMISTVIFGIVASCDFAQPQTAGEIVFPIGNPVRPPGNSSKVMCTEPNALVVGRLAYIETKLELTPAQRPFWEKWRQIVIEGANKERTACLQDVATANGNPTIVERLAHYAQTLSDEVENLKAAQPELEALYQALTPEQKAILDQTTGGIEQR